MKKTIFFSVLALLVVALGIFAYCSFDGEESDGYVDTPIDIADIKPTGKLFVMEAYIEDYKIDTLHEATAISRIKNLFGSKDKGRKHFRMMTKTVSAKFYVNLDSLEMEYAADDKILRIREPKVETYYGDVPGVESDYKCDDDDFWDKRYPDHGNSLSEQISKSIRAKFDTEENRQKALQHAKADIARIYEAFRIDVEYYK